MLLPGADGDAWVRGAVVGGATLAASKAVATGPLSSSDLIKPLYTRLGLQPPVGVPKTQRASERRASRTPSGGETPRVAPSSL